MGTIGSNGEHHMISEEVRRSPNDQAVLEKAQRTNGFHSKRQW
jgi:hypothetical protein